MAAIYVGGASTVEVKEKMDRCDDSIRATKSALEGGIVPGGGYALLSAEKLDIITDNRDAAAGAELVKGILSAPLRQMCKNAGLDDGYIVGKCRELNLGYNFMTDNFEDLKVTGVVDPAKVVIATIQQAASVAGTILSSGGLIVEQQPAKQS